MASKLINCVVPLSFPFKTQDPFLFCVYHKDHYPAGDAKMQAPRRGNGADFDPSAAYRMYHGERIPGFPQHPHRGFETVTATLEGIIDHTDSLGNAGRYGHGDLQWMTAGKGVVHGEMFPLVNDSAPNPLTLFQIWLNLPKKSKMVDATYVMHWAERIPQITSADGKAKVRLWAGQLQGQGALAPPPNSWAADQDNEVMILHIDIAPGGTFEIPAARGGSAINRSVYFLEGAELDVGGQQLTGPTGLELNAALPAPLVNRHATQNVQVLVLQGRPIGEPVAHRGPFVMNTAAELQQAYIDYSRTQFGGWPWDEDAVVFPKDQGRFSKVDGKEERP